MFLHQSNIVTGLVKGIHLPLVENHSTNMERASKRAGDQSRFGSCSRSDTVLKIFVVLPRPRRFRTRRKYPVAKISSSKTGSM